MRNAEMHMWLNHSQSLVRVYLYSSIKKKNTNNHYVVSAKYVTLSLASEHTADEGSKEMDNKRSIRRQPDQTDTRHRSSTFSWASWRNIKKDAAFSVSESHTKHHCNKKPESMWQDEDHCYTEFTDHMLYWPWRNTYQGPELAQEDPGILSARWWGAEGDSWGSSTLCSTTRAPIRPGVRSAILHRRESEATRGMSAGLKHITMHYRASFRAHPGASAASYSIMHNTMICFKISGKID